MSVARTSTMGYPASTPPVRASWMPASIEEMYSRGITPPVICGDGAYGDNTEFRSGLEERELEYVLDVKATTSAYREDVKPTQPPKPEGRGRPPGTRYP